jgi:hypothetical protein
LPRWFTAIYSLALGGENSVALTLPTSDDATELVILCWSRNGGSVSASMPLPYERAEAVALVYAALHPEEDYWFKPLPHSGRRRGHS